MARALSARAGRQIKQQTVEHLQFAEESGLTHDVAMLCEVSFLWLSRGEGLDNLDTPLLASSAISPDARTGSSSEPVHPQNLSMRARKSIEKISNAVANAGEALDAPLEFYANWISRIRDAKRSEERRVGKGCVSTCRSGRAE